MERGEGRVRWAAGHSRARQCPASPSIRVGPSGPLSALKLHFLQEDRLPQPQAVGRGGPIAPDLVCGATWQFLPSKGQCLSRPSTGPGCVRLVPTNRCGASSEPGPQEALSLPSCPFGTLRGQRGRRGRATDDVQEGPEEPPSQPQLHLPTHSARRRHNAQDCALLSSS